MLEAFSMKSLLAVSLFLGLGMIACGTSTEATDEGAGAATEGEAAGTPEFTCDDSQRAETNVGETDPGKVTNVRIGAHADFDRIVFDLEHGTASANVEVRKNPGMRFIGEERRRDGRQGPDVEGSAALHVRIFTADVPAESAPKELKPQSTKAVRHVRSFSAFEGDLEYLIGLERASCFRTFFLTGPERVVVDVKH
jgi:hypothetical protein